MDIHDEHDSSSDEVSTRDLMTSLATLSKTWMLEKQLRLRRYWSWLRRSRVMREEGSSPLDVARPTRLKLYDIGFTSTTTLVAPAIDTIDGAGVCP
ncbi:hypothetical protein TanjilG_07262 [Lupinus angustifolius]|uniref:Uncharacterized protein n=1 Tax=Lupinus angustifolius TaxID=3871 RepID=A0A1J7GRN2_LUPAN|nr:hypothetical protein TanjilG_07262 [Lupinus angustifolius]